MLRMLVTTKLCRYRYVPGLRTASRYCQDSLLWIQPREPADTGTAAQALQLLLPVIDRPYLAYTPQSFSNAKSNFLGEIGSTCHFIDSRIYEFGVCRDREYTRRSSMMVFSMQQDFIHSCLTLRNANRTVLVRNILLHISL